LLIVGLAPGLQGANRTGRPFTGDWAGDLLYETLGRYGFARGEYAERADDGLTLELIRGERVQNQKDYERMRKKRGGDTLPPPLSFAGYTDRRPIALFY
jgi:uracil-DNA glycosylase